MRWRLDHGLVAAILAPRFPGQGRPSVESEQRPLLCPSQGHRPRFLGMSVVGQFESMSAVNVHRACIAQNDHLVPCFNHVKPALPDFMQQLAHAGEPLDVLPLSSDYVSVLGTLGVKNLLDPGVGHLSSVLLA